jgi:glycosyltransferase involved in cell wall biosynthesis
MPAKQPLVSVITIFLNGEKFIEEAIRSVLAQTYSNWELILVDDGSSDASTALAQHWVTRCPHQIRYFEHPGHENRGMSASRNLGVERAWGDYIAFVDADDVWLPRKLEEQLTLFQTHSHAAMVYGRTEIWFSWTGTPEDQERDYSYPLGLPSETLIEPPALVRSLLENKFQTPTTCSALIRKKVYQQLGGFQESFRGMFEDQAFFLKLCLREPVFVSGNCWARYRQHADSCCAIAERSGQDYAAARLPLLRWFRNYLIENQIADSEVWRALRIELGRSHRPVAGYLSRMLKTARRFVRL